MKHLFTSSSCPYVGTLPADAALKFLKKIENSLPAAIRLSPRLRTHWRCSRPDGNRPSKTSKWSVYSKAASYGHLIGKSRKYRSFTQLVLGRERLFGHNWNRAYFGQCPRNDVKAFGQSGALAFEKLNMCSQFAGSRNSWAGDNSWSCWTALYNWIHYSSSILVEVNFKRGDHVESCRLGAACHSHRTTLKSAHDSKGK